MCGPPWSLVVATTRGDVAASEIRGVIAPIGDLLGYGDPGLPTPTTYDQLLLRIFVVACSALEICSLL